MNLSELISSGAALEAIIALMVLLVALGLTWRLSRQWLATVHRLDDVESDVAIYAEASTRVAQTLEELLLAREKPGATVHSSRRYLLQKARERMSEGEAVRTLARSLGLSYDEVRLLERNERAGTDGRPSQGAAKGAASPVP